MRRTIFTLIMLCIATLTLQAQDVWTAAGSSMGRNGYPQ